MATIKSFTDLSQSKILSKILPLDSADMFWLVLGNTPRVHVLTEPLSNYSNWENYPCWSLAALLSVLPKYELNNFGNIIQLDVNLEALVIEGDETLLDLVVNMIIHLHELKML